MLKPKSWGIIGDWMHLQTFFKLLWHTHIFEFQHNKQFNTCHFSTFYYSFTIV